MRARISRHSLINFGLRSSKLSISPSSRGTRTYAFLVPRDLRMVPREMFKSRNTSTLVQQDGPDSDRQHPVPADDIPATDYASILHHVGGFVHGDRGPGVVGLSLDHLAER